MQLLASYFVICTKKSRVNKTDKEAGEALKTNITYKKKVPIKLVKKNNSKASIFISGFVSKPLLNIQVFLINTKIVILVLYLFQISSKFREETERLMSVLRKPRVIT